MGLLVWPGYELPFIARELGWLPTARVQLVDFRSPGEVMRAYRHGLVDALAITGGYALELGQESEEHRVVLVIDFSRGGDVLVARPGIETLADLRGSRVGLDNSNLGFHVLARALQAAGLTPDDVTPVPVDVAEHEKAYRSGLVDAVVTYEPMVTRLLEDGAHPLFDSSSMPGEIVDVLVTRDSTLASRRDDVQLLVDAWLRAQQRLQQAPEEVASIGAARESLTESAFLSSFDGLDLVDRARNRRLLADGSELADTLRSLTRLLRDYGAAFGSVNLDTLLDDRLVREPAPESVP